MAGESYFYVGPNKKPVGPYTLSELRELATRGVIGPTTKVIRKGDKAWVAWSSLSHAPGQTPAASREEPLVPALSASELSSSISSLINRIPKYVLFGLVGALGCLAGAILGEVFLALFPNPKPENKSTLVDIMFALDVTGSMSGEINGIKNGVIDFADTLSTNSLDIRIGLIAFGDLTQSETPQILSFDEGSPFTTNAVDFSREVGTIRMVRGGDEPESSYDAVALAAKQPFRRDSRKTIVLITDASPQRGISVSNTVDILREYKIEDIHLVIKDKHLRDYKPLQTGANGKVFPLSATAGGRQSFDRILEGIAIEIIADNPPPDVLGKRTKDPLLTFLSAGGWFALIAVFMALALGVAQNKAMGRTGLSGYLTSKQLLFGCLIGIGAGLIAGLINLVFVLVSDEMFDQQNVTTLQLIITFIGGVVAWCILGGIIGTSMVLVIENFGYLRAIAGGLAGGLLGGLVFNLISLISGAIGGEGALISSVGEGIGRVLGAVLVGALIGAFIAWVEQLTRNAWLTVYWTANQQSNINLGKRPITVGGGKDDIRIKGLGESTLSIVLTGGRILCTQQPNNKETELKDQSVLNLGKIRLVVNAVKTS